MKRICLFFFLILFLALNVDAQAVPDVTLGGTITNISGTPIAGTVTATLGNYGANPPVVTGTSTIVPLQVSTTANGSGVWSLTLWGEDQISPVNTTYTVSISPANSNVVIWIAEYLIKSGTYDISNLVPLVVTPTSYVQQIPGPQGAQGIPGTPGGSIGTGNDNIFTAPQRFQGPIPWRDFTAYMPAGGCSVLNDLPTYLATGTMTSSSANLALSSAADWKNGCGVTVEGAGPTSTLVVPSCGTVSTAARAGTTTVTVACGAATGLVAASQSDQGVVMSGCNISAYNGTFPIQDDFANGIGLLSTQFTYTTTSGTDSATGCSATFLLGWAVGTLGSTDYYYWGAPIDSGSGMGAAVGPIHISNGNASLSSVNFNWVETPLITGARMLAWYRGSTSTEASATCVGVSFDIGFTDYGIAGPCPAMIPTAPPTTQIAQALTTTITSGGGTTTLVLAATASNNATSQRIFHDEMPFLDTCINGVNTDQNTGRGYNSGSWGCYIPNGVWHFNSDFSTDRITPLHGGIHMMVAGTPYMEVWPWMVSQGNYDIEGIGFSGGSTNFSDFPVTAMMHQSGLPAAFVYSGGSPSVLRGFSDSGLAGDGIVVTENPATGAGSSAISMDRMLIQMTSVPSGVPLRIGPNSLKDEFSRMNLTPGQTGFPASVLFTNDTYNSVGQCCIKFDNFVTEWHHFYFTAPGGLVSGQGTDLEVSNFESEEHGQYPTGGTITIQTGNTGGAPGAQSPSARIAGISFDGRFQNADASNKTMFQILGQNSAQAAIYLNGNADAFNQMIGCDASVPNCASQAGITFVSNVSQGASNYGAGHAIANNGKVQLEKWSHMFMASSADIGASPQQFAWSDGLAAPTSLTLTSTGSGSLAAATYCMMVVLLDNEATPQESLPSPELCTTVGASSNILLGWNLLNRYGCGNSRLYYGTSGPGSELNYVTTGANCNGLTAGYTFTSTSGNVSKAFPTMPLGVISWISRDSTKPSCFLCSSGINAGYNLGINQSNPQYQLDVRGGVHASSDFDLNSKLLASATAPTISAHFNTSGDSISSNNGTASFRVTVGTGAGTSTGTVTLPTAPTGWNCTANNLNRADLIQQTGGNATTAIFTNYGLTIGTPVNFTNSDVLSILCFPN